MATFIKIDGSEEQVEPANGTDFSLEELRKFVGGYIQVISFPNNKIMILNEEGKLEGLQENRRATLLGRICGIMNDDYIVGNVLICKKEEIK